MLRFILKFCVSVAVLFLVFRNVPVSEVISTLDQLSFVVVFWGIILYLFAMFVSAIKWKLLLPEHQFRSLFKFTFVGQFYSLVLPGQLFGEVAKAYRLGKGRVDAPQIAVSVLFDKLTGVAGLFLVGLVSSLFSSTNVPIGVHVLMGGGFLAMLLVFFIPRSIFWYSFFTRQIEHVLARFISHGDTVRKIMDTIKQYRAYVQNTRLLVQNIFLGVVFQVLAVAITALCASAFGIFVPPADWFWIFGIVSLAVLLPVTIAGLGIREGTFVGILALFSVAPSSAIALSLAVFGVQIFAALVGGFLELVVFMRKSSK